MGNELSIHIKVILASGNTEGWDIDRNVKHAEESEGEHSGNCVNKSRPVDSREV
jgi:hypothetical protein